VTYTTNLGTAFSTSAGVTMAIGAATGTGWSATASHNATTKTCGIFVGSATSPVSGANEGEPKCP
jgi:hypothetical protein